MHTSKPFFFLLGVINHSPLRLELEFATNLADNWMVAYTFTDLNRVDYSGSPSVQEVFFHQL